MSRTALHCFLALGISVSLAAACGDDEGGDGIGGSGGSAGSSGMAGSSGGGTGGTSGGSAGSAGEAGSSGTGGTGGTGGAQGGTGGGSSGDGGSAGDDDPDAGDGGPDGSVVEEPDASTGGTGGAGGTGGTGGTGGDGGTGGSGSVADCPAVQNVVDANNNQDIGIVRVLFEDDTVAIRNLATPVENDAGATVLSLSSVFLCNGPEDCVDLGQDGDCDVFEIALGEDAVCAVPDALDPVEGELALLNALPDASGAFIRSYLAWGDTFVSPVIPGGATSLEDLAVAGTFWTDGDRIAAPTGGQDAIYATGDLEVDTGYTVCTED